MIYIGLGIMIVLLITIIINHRKSKYRLPPGPFRLPVIGNLLQLGTTPHLKFSQWASSYGEMYTIFLGTQPTLVVNNANLIRKLFGMMPATGKFKTEILTDLTNGAYGVSQSEGRAWLEQKQFFLRALKDSGFCRGTSMEASILQEVQTVINILQADQMQNDKVFLSSVFQEFATNILWNVAAGGKVKSKQNEIAELLEEFMVHIQTAAKTGLVFYPKLKYIAPNLSGYNAFQNWVKRFHQLIQQYFDEHVKDRNQDDEPKDLIDMYLEKMESCQNQESSFYGDKGWKNSFATIASLFLAGSELIGTSLNWTIFYLIAEPSVQLKLQEEILKVIGPDRNPCLADRKNMSYMEAVILESLRLSSTGPMGIMHELLEDISINGYNLPKGMLLTANLYHVHYDKNIWKDPENFRPERFLESNNNGVDLADYVVAFQPGKRSCPGESFSKDVVFLFLAKILQQLTFGADADVKDTRKYLEPDTGMTLIPKKIAVVLKNRI